MLPTAVLTEFPLEPLETPANRASDRSKRRPPESEMRLPIFIVSWTWTPIRLSSRFTVMLFSAAGAM